MINMEHFVMPALLATASVGQTITKSTGVSIALVVMLMGATYFAGITFASTNNRISNLEEDIGKISVQQAAILKAIQNNNVRN